MGRKLCPLEFALRQRFVVQSPNGTSRSERNYLDFIVDGESVVNLGRYDLVSVLCREWVPTELEKSVNRLLGTEPADFPNDRRSILVCGECGDIGCGAVSVIIDFSNGSAIWKDFDYQNNYEPEIHGQHLKRLGPFEFDLERYKARLFQALETLNANL